MQNCCSARAGTPGAAHPARYSPIPEASTGTCLHLSLQGTVFYSPISPKYLSPQYPPATALSPGGSGPCASQALLPLPWLPRVPAGCRLGVTAPEALELSCHLAVTSEAVSPAGGLACQSQECFQLQHFKPPRCAGAHLSYLEELALCSN